MNYFSRAVVSKPLPLTSLVSRNVLSLLSDVPSLKDLFRELGFLSLLNDNLVCMRKLASDYDLSANDTKPSFGRIDNDEKLERMSLSVNLITAMLDNNEENAKALRKV
jgi:hypothetical protein